MACQATATNETQVFTAPRGLWWLSLFVLVLLSLLILLVGGIGIGLIMTEHPVAGVILLALAAFLVVILRQVLRNTFGLGGWRITLDRDSLHLALPASRSLTHRLERVDRSLPLDQIAGVETRLEAYRSLGMANLNRSFALRLADGSTLILGEDRGQGTDLATRFVSDAAQALADRGTGLRDLGMVEGQGGLAGVAFVDMPGWDAPAVAADQAEMLVLRARRTGMLAGVAGLIVLIIVAAQAFL